MDLLNKKNGQAVFDLTLLVIVVFVIAIAAVFGGFLYSELNDEIQNDNDFSATAKSTSASINTSYSSWFDNVIFMAIILLWIALLITSFMIDTNPVFFIITIIFMVVVFVIGMGMSNAYDEITSDSDLNNYVNNFSKTNFIFDNFLIVLIVIGFTTALALYAKGGGGL